MTQMPGKIRLSRDRALFTIAFTSISREHKTAVRSQKHLRPVTSQSRSPERKSTHEYEDDSDAAIQDVVLVLLDGRLQLGEAAGQLPGPVGVVGVLLAGGDLGDLFPLLAAGGGHEELFGGVGEIGVVLLPVRESIDSAASEL